MKRIKIIIIINCDILTAFNFSPMAKADMQHIGLPYKSHIEEVPTLTSKIMHLQIATLTYCALKRIRYFCTCNFAVIYAYFMHFI